MAARGAALNPTSLPFFPGGTVRSEEDQNQGGGGGGPKVTGLGFRAPSGHVRDRDYTSSSTASDYRSFRSSPSPPYPLRTDSPESTRSGPRDNSFTPLHRHVEANVTRSLVDSTNSDVDPTHKDMTRMDTPTAAHEGAPLPTGDNEPIPVASGTPGTLPISILRLKPTLDQLDASGISNANISVVSRSSPANLILASSPASSAGDSSAKASTGIEHLHSLEVQLKASPFINDILDRLVRCELSTREVRRELGDVHRKVNLLVERSFSNSDPMFRHPDRSVNNSEPTFRNPFASSATDLPKAQAVNGPASYTNGGSGSVNLPPGRSQDEIAQISQRLNTLTTSVSQLLALQQHMHSMNSGFQPPQGHPPNAPGTVAEQLSSSSVPPPPPIPGPHALPNRPDLRPPSRTPNPPMRTWSAGSLDLPMRPPDNNVGLGRPEAFLRDKRRSVAGLMRRDSSTMPMTDGSSDSWNGSPREGGPVVSKWEHLPLSPDLLRSIAKFGVGPPNKIQQRALPFLLRGADIIAQAPPTQERIAAYVIPAIHIALGYLANRPSTRGPIVVMISTTVDQATQAQRMIRDLGGPIGVRSALGVGANVRSEDITQELHLLHQNVPHILCGTPQKLHALFTASHGLVGSEVRFLVLDEVDQLIARNLHDFVFNIVKLLPPPRSRPLGGPNIPGTPSTSPVPGPQAPFTGFDTNGTTNGGGTAVTTPFQQGRRFSTVLPLTNDAVPSANNNGNGSQIERQTALFSNTVPQDVLNLANAIQLREPVRVLVRRDGNVTHADTSNGARGLRQFYLYLAFTAGGRLDPTPATPGGGLGIIGSGRGASSSNAETAQAREWKLDALADLFDDIEVSQAIVHVGGLTALDSVVYKLASRGLEAVPLHGDMNAGTKLAALNKFRGSTSIMIRQQPVTKVLVVYDVQVKAPDVFQVPLVINYDLPKAVEEYAHRVAPAISSSYSRAGVVINFVTATGGDVEMLRSIECFYKIKCPEVPMSLRDVI
ncbi:hypothetical protein K439DRAFT_1625895 [Ramaria rubella]|nr:hypothetical protein K439DRAFT_1625895 [Ramaria rubella]